MKSKLFQIIRLRLPSARACTAASLVFASLCADMRAASTAPGYVIVPLTPMGRENQNTIRVTINDQRTMLIVDTGATGTVLDGRFYRAAHVRSNDAAPGQLPPEVGKKFKANGEPAEVGYVDSLKAGGVELGKRPVAVMDLNTVFGRFNNLHGNTAVGGLLGEDVLRQYGAIIDWGRRGVFLNVDPSKRTNPYTELTTRGWTAIPMALTNHRHFTVESTVEGKAVRLIVDTGAAFTSFSRNVIPLKSIIYNRDTGPSMARLASTAGSLSMIGSDSTMHPARLEHWKIGAFEVPTSSVAVAQLPAGLLAEESAGEGPILGLLGAEVLAKNNAIIDLAGAKLYLKSGKF